MPQLLSCDTVGEPGVRIRAQIWVAWAALAVVPLATTWADPDLGGHLRYGLDILRDWTLPRVDPYSFTQDRPWVNHEWLSEAIMAGAYTLLGAPGLVLLKSTLTVLTFVLLHRRLRGLSPLAAAFILSLALLCALGVTFTVRPQLWSMLALAAVVAWIDRPQAPGPRFIGVLGGLFAVWANLHGGWIVGAALLAVYAAGRAWRCPDERARWLLAVTVALASTLVTPYGVEMWELLLTTVRPSRPEITEWRSLGPGVSLMYWLPFGLLAGACAWLLRHRETRPTLETSLAILFFLVASLRALRLGPLIAPAALMLLAPSLGRAIGHAGHVTVRGTAAARLMWIPVCVVVAAVAPAVIAHSKCIEMRGPWVPDRVAAASLKGISGRLWTTFTWGQYANWQFGPALRVSIDGRLEVYSDDVRQLHRDFERGEKAARLEFLRLSPDVVWLPARLFEIRDWLSANGYRIDIDTADSFVAVKETLPRLEHRAALPECFQ